MANRNAGGGFGSRVVKSGPAGRKVEPRPRAVSPGAVSQIGSSMGNHVTEVGREMNPRGASEPLYSGQGYKAPYGVKLNAKPEVMGSGTQGCHGPVAGQVPKGGRDILSEYGRDSAAVGPRK
jgi:hypothetical protein